MRTYFCLLILFTFFGCQSEKASPDIKLQFTFLKDSNYVNTQIRGVWKSIGNGYYLEAREDSIVLYSYTKSFTCKEKNDYLEGLLNSQSQFRLREDTLEIYLTDYGNATSQLQTKKDFLKVEKLPKGLISFKELRQLPPKQQLKLYEETLRENFAFTERRNLDWDQIFSTYQDRIIPNNDSLFRAMGEIATLTKDQHTKVINKEGKRLQYNITPSALDVQADFENQSEIEDLNQYFNHFFNTSYQNISDSILGGKGKKVLNNNIEWGQINDEVGYIHIHSFAGFLGREFTREQQIDSIKKHMDEIIHSLKNSKAIIVDVSFNFGGYDAAALTIASYFTDKPRFAYTSQVFNQGEFYDEDVVTIYPADSVRFTGPVYVLTTDISRSAAEGFGMMMDVLPNVKLVGTHTLGIFSGMLGKSICEFYVTCSNQRLVNLEGKYFEGTGLIPDIKMTVFPRGNVLNGHREAVEGIVKMIK